MKKLICLLPILIIGCSAGIPTGAMKEYDRLMNDSDLHRSQLLSALIALDQKYPRNSIIKIDIGVLHLLDGNFAEADTFFDQVLSKRFARMPREKRYLLYAGKGETLYRSGDYAGTRAMVKKARKLKYPDKLGTAILQARSRFRLNERAEALKEYDVCWNEQRDLMTEEDFQYYLDLLVADKQDSKALTVLWLYEKGWGYRKGLGLVESTIYERMGLYGESVVAAFFDLYYLLSTGEIDSGLFRERMDDLEKLVIDNGYSAGFDWGPFFETLIRFADGDEVLPDSLSVYLSSLDLKNTESPHMAFIVRSAGIRKAEPGEMDFVQYSEMEAAFRSFPAYYYHLWSGMKRGPGKYSLGTARPVLEKTIYLAPTGPFANASRVELAVLNGLPESDGRFLLVGPELDRIYNAYLLSRDIAVLKPVMDLMTIGNCPYTMAGEQLLQVLSREDPQVRKLLGDTEKNASGILLTRIRNILNS